MSTEEGARKSDTFMALCDAPDHCRTPPGDAPVPFQVLARLDAAIAVSPDVSFGGLPSVLVDESSIPSVTGDEGGTGGGVKSGKHKGEVKFIAGARTVRINGKPPVRHKDPVTLNDGNTTGKVRNLAGAAPAGQVGPEGQPGMEPHSPPEPPLERTDKEVAIRLLQGIASTMQGKPGEVLILVWDWKGFGVVGDDHSVGHVAAAVKSEEGGWSIVQSQFPHGPGGNSAPLGPNTTIAKAAILREVEGGHKPNSAFLVSIPDLGAYASTAIADQKKPWWYVYPIRYNNSTNCTFGVVQALRSGGVPLSAMWANMTLISPAAPFLPRDLRTALSREAQFNVINNYKVYHRNKLIDTIDWGM